MSSMIDVLTEIAEDWAINYDLVGSFAKFQVEYVFIDMLFT